MTKIQVPEVNIIPRILLVGILVMQQAYSLAQHQRQDSTGGSKMKVPDSVFYQRLEQKSYNSKLLKEFFDWTIKNQESAGKPELTDNTAKWHAFKGLVISNIVVKQPPPGASLLPILFTSDTSKINKLFLKLHVYTKASVLLKNLYINPGDSLIPWQLAENEKLIRDLPFIEDARFYPELVSNDSITLILVVVDKIPYGAFPVYHSNNKQSLKIWNSNFMGYGNELGFRMTHEKPTLYLSEIYFTINNLNKLFIQNSIKYRRSLQEEEYTLKLERAYLPGAYKLAGGFEMGHKQEILPAYYSPAPDIEVESRFLAGNLWLGYQFEYESKNPSKRPVFIVPAMAFYGALFQKRPFVSIDSNYILNNSTKVMMSMHWLDQNFAESYNLFSQNIVQELPVGSSAGFTLGYNWSEFRKMPYFGFDIKRSFLGKHADYWVFSVGFGSHLYRQKLTQGAFAGSAHYITKLFSAKRYSFRFLGGLNYTRGINRLSYDSLNLNNEYGITGLRSDALKGMQRVNSELQFILYTPWKWIGFSFTPYLLFEAGFISQENDPVFNSRLISGLGIGMRLRNKYLVFSSIQLRLMYYPYIPENASSWSVDLSDNLDWETLSFDPGRPDEIKFR